MTTQTKTCQNCKTTFIIAPDELGMYEKLEMPLPKICVKCRWQKYLGFWVFGKFRYGKSDLSGEKIITVLPENPGHPIYSLKEWYSDAWNGLDYGQDYDPNRPFFDQLEELQAKVPRPHQSGKNNLNCDWCDDVWDCKNCYLSRSLANCEELMYGYRDLNVKNSVDITYSYDLEKCYDTTYSFNCFNVRYSFNSRDCMDSSFLIDCRNVSDCFMCWNLRNKRYCIRNTQFTKEDYQKELAKINLGSRKTADSLKNEFETIAREEAVHRENLNVKNTNVSGNYINRCKDCINAFHFEDSENCHNVLRGAQNKSCIDTVGCLKTELCANSQNLNDGGYSVKSSSLSTLCRYCEYIDQCVRCENCFGCVGLIDKKFCVLNKQYSEQEYHELRAKIIESMRNDSAYGDFFPTSMAYGGYNMSSAQMYFPLTKKEALGKGYKWEEVANQTDGVSPDHLSDDIKDAKDEITAQALICPQTHYRFNISQRELEFYRMMNVPLPRAHPDQRNLERFKKLVVIDAYPYNCAYCNKEIMAYYLPEWGYKKIACGECYQREIA